jgi:hypothetical protein
MLNNQGQAASVVSLLAAVSAANTAAATSAWVDARKYEGDLVFVLDVGIVTAGTLTWTIEHADDGSGTNGAGITPTEGAPTQLTTSNDPLVQKVTVPATAVKGFVRVLGTIVTGPALVSAVMLAHPKYV